MVKINGIKVEITDELMNTIATYMDDDIRETVHHELAPCTLEEFFNAIWN